MIFVDANVPMYLIGAEHPNKHLAAGKLDALIKGHERLVTDAEVQQEILHRYTSLGRRDAIQPAFDALQELVDEVFPIEPRDVGRAKTLLLERPSLSARDAIHAAVMERHGVAEILTFDRGFDTVPGIRRI